MKPGLELFRSAQEMGYAGRSTCPLLNLQRDLEAQEGETFEELSNCRVVQATPLLRPATVPRWD